jgi:hypothetical protein
MFRLRPNTVSALALLLAAAFLLSLFPSTADAAECIPRREYRWYEYLATSCCTLDYPPGYQTSYFERIKRKQYRDLSVYCTWSAWQNADNILHVTCSSFSPKCYYVDQEKPLFSPAQPYGKPPMSEAGDTRLASARFTSCAEPWLDAGTPAD